MCVVVIIKRLVTPILAFIKSESPLMVTILKHESCRCINNSPNCQNQLTNFPVIKSLMAIRILQNVFGDGMMLKGIGNVDPCWM